MKDFIEGREVPAGTEDACASVYELLCRIWRPEDLLVPGADPRWEVQAAEVEPAEPVAVEAAA